MIQSSLSETVGVERVGGGKENMEEFLFWEDSNSSDFFPNKAIATYWLTAATYIKPSS